MKLSYNFFRFFFIIYVMEMIIKMCGFGVLGYFRSHWNKLDFFIIVMATGGQFMLNTYLK